MPKMNPRERLAIERQHGEQLKLIMDANSVELKRCATFIGLLNRIRIAGGFKCADGKGGVRMVEVGGADGELWSERVHELLEAVRRREDELGVDVLTGLKFDGVDPGLLR